jgi:hypothetical protein
MVALADVDGDYKIRPAEWMKLFDDLELQVANEVNFNEDES